MITRPKTLALKSPTTQLGVEQDLLLGVPLGELLGRHLALLGWRGEGGGECEGGGGCVRRGRCVCAEMCLCVSECGGEDVCAEGVSRCRDACADV